MISLVLYGRNDSYGYNLHKRAALSLNCMAEVLRAPGDEILFVDYNTPNDFPTFPEAIEDTLTERARNMLRVFRVRPEIHAFYKEKSHLAALEPIARNVAIRRSSPENRWILSTNTDMIFLPRGKATVDELAKDLPSGFYHLPRFEIPESLWEGFNRLDPGDVFEALRHWGPTAHLHEIVYGAKTILYDAPGDFQLVERKDLFEMAGFHEGMLRGWHVDSNLAKRLYVKYGKVGSLLDGLFGYHCDHTRQTTPAHAPNRVENSLQIFIDEVSRFDLPEQAATWGLAGDEIEEIRLGRSSSRLYMQAIEGAMERKMTIPTEASYTSPTYDAVDYDPAHVLPFLIDIFVNLPRGSRLGWRGTRRETFRLFCSSWTGADLGGILLVEEAEAAWLGIAPSPSVRIVSAKELYEHSIVFIFDFGAPEESSGKRLFGLVSAAFSEMALNEQGRLARGIPSRRFIALNAIHNRYEGLVRDYVASSATPFSSRIRHGYIVPPSNKTTIYGPYSLVAPGYYRLTAKVGGYKTPWGFGKEKNYAGLHLEIVNDEFPLAVRYLKWADIREDIVILDFHIHPALCGSLMKKGIEGRIRSYDRTPLEVDSVRIEYVKSFANEDPPFYRTELIRTMTMTGGKRTNLSIDRLPGLEPGIFLGGPSWRLPQGRYRLVIGVVGRAEVRLEVVVFGDVLAEKPLTPSGSEGEHVIEFTVSEKAAKSPTFEARVLALDKNAFQVTRVFLEQITIDLSV